MLFGRTPVLTAFLGLALCGCVSAKIAVVDERTALENQILGSYEELDRDLQLIASVRSSDDSGRAGGAAAFSRIRERAIQARQTQQFNQDDVDELKAAGCLGEVHDGTLAARDCPDGSDPRVRDRIDRLVTTENDARRTILQFIVTASPDLTEKDLPQVVTTYARMQRNKVKKGEWVRESAGWKQAD
jgi:hypothetical protein